MAETKRYYWLRLKDDFFSSKRIKKLRKLAGGDTYTIIYLKMQLKALATDGLLEYTGIENSFAEELALDIDEDVDNVRVTIQYLLSVGLLETNDETLYFLPFVKECTGSETASTQRVRDFRKRQKALHCNTNETEVKRLCNVEKEKEKEKEINMSEKSDESVQNNSLQDELKKNFEIIYASYPVKKGKTKGFEHYKAWVTNGRVISGTKHKLTNKQIWTAIAKYKKEMEEQGTELQYYKHFDTFMCKAILDYVDEEK